MVGKKGGAKCSAGIECGISITRNNDRCHQDDKFKP